MKNTLICLTVAALSCAVFGGEGLITSKPVWELKEHGGARPLSTKNVLEIPNSAIPNFSAFTIEAKVRFGELPEGRGFTLFDQTVSETGWGLWFTTIRSCASPMMLRVNGEDYTCSLALHKLPPGSTHTFTVTARKGWIVTYKDGIPQKSFMMSITPNLAPITVGGPHTPYPKDELDGLVLEDLKIWGDDEEYWGLGEDHQPTLGFKAGKGWLVNVPVKPLANKPNLFYYGDSISTGYTEPFTKLVQGRANLYHWTSFLSSAGALGKREKAFADVCKLADYDYIVFNNGLHSLHWTEKKYSDAEIEASYRSVVQTFRKHAPKAKIVYLMTTPHTASKDAAGKVNGLGELNDIVLRLNRIAGKVMNEENVAVIDGYGLLVNHLDLARGDQYHWKPPAYEILAAEIVKAFGL